MYAQFRKVTVHEVIQNPAIDHEVSYMSQLNGAQFQMIYYFVHISCWL